MLGCSFACVSGVLLVPVVGLDAVTLTLLALQVFGAAVIGRLTSLPLTYAGALIVGLGQALSTKFVAGHPALAGIPTSFPFIVLFAILVFSPKGRFLEAMRTERLHVGQRRIAATRFPRRAIVLLVAFAAVLPTRLDGSQTLTATTTLVFVLIFLSLSLLIGLSRQVSLTHAMFVVFGATTLSHLQEAGVPWLVALLLAGLVLVPVAALVAIPAIRLSGLFLALATFGFGILAQFLLFATPFVFGTESVVRISRPDLFGISLAGDKPYYYFVLAVVVLGACVVEAVRVSRMGRVLRAMADSQTATESLGVNPMVSRVLVFCVSGFLAAVAGGLFGTLTNAVNPQSLDFFQSLLWVAVLVTAGAASLAGSVLAAVLLIAVPATFASAAMVKYQPVFFGVAAILLAQAPNGLAGMFRVPDFTALAQRSAWRRGRRRTMERLAS
jgi:ABC-type branched-subunit amino acid transport system permease subunit